MANRLEKFRNKLKLPKNHDVQLLYKEKSRINNQTYREKQLEDETSALAFRKRRAEQEKARREKKAKAKFDEECLDESFNSNSALGKAVKRVENVLPTNKSKAKEVVEVVARKLDITLTETSRKSISKQRKNFKETPDLVGSFYLLDCISRQLPGKKDFLNVKDKSGTKHKIQKRLMLMSVEEAYKEFKEMFPDQPVSSSKFHSLRPAHVVIMSKAPHNMCCCTYCENMQYIFDALLPFTTNVIDSLKDLTIKLCCSRDNYECVAGSCDDCKDIFTSTKQFLLPGCENEKVQLLRWEKVGDFVQKVLKPSIEMKLVIEMFVDSFRYFALHKYLVRTQFEFMTKTKLTQAENECLLIMDFSQNYSTISQNEVQFAFFTQRQISVFTAYAYVGQTKPIPFIIVNDDISHNKFQVWYYMRLIIQEIKQRCPLLEHVRVLTDGCACQFKNKYILSNLIRAKEDFGVTVEWHFSPTSHGKSEADGLGGTFKRNVYNRVLTGRHEVYNAKDFFDCAKSFADDTKLICVSDHEYSEFQAMLKSRWASVKNIPGTRNFHLFAPTQEENKIFAAVSSRKDGLKMFKVQMIFVPHA